MGILRGRIIVLASLLGTFFGGACIAGASLIGVSVAKRATDAERHARFAVRGRWDGPREITYRIEPDQSPLAPAVFARAVRAALAEWESTGCFAFREADVADEPPLIFAWRTGAHEDCPAFGADPGVAHAGPVGPWTFVHFDAEREWSAPSLRRAALHEIGHVLGLDHAPDEAAVMYPEPGPERARLAPSDRAGIHSLYGGGADAPGDLVVTSGEVRLVLRSVAPAEVTDWTLFDTDGDGDDEVVVWRTDAAGRGALWSYHFARGPLLARTIGPLYGATAPGSEVELVRLPDGARLIVLEREGSAPQARRFDARGLLDLFEGELPPNPAPPRARVDAPEGDLDGDGERERVRRTDAPARP